ncbi:Feather keratin 3, partial [Eurypyga helias]
LRNEVKEGKLRQYKDSHVIIHPPAMLVTLPGPILSSLPQSNTIGSSSPAAMGSILDAQGVLISSSGFG